MDGACGRGVNPQSWISWILFILSHDKIQARLDHAGHRDRKWAESDPNSIVFAASRTSACFGSLAIYE